MFSKEVHAGKRRKSDLNQILRITYIKEVREERGIIKKKKKRRGGQKESFREAFV